MKIFQGIQDSKFVDNNGDDYFLPFEKKYKGDYEWANRIFNVIELTNNVLLHGSSADDDEELRNIVSINKQTKEVEWQIDPCYGWEIPGATQWMYPDPNEYSDLLAFVEDKQGALWHEVEYKYSKPESEFDVSQYIPHPGYINSKKYRMISEYWNIVEKTKELIKGYDTNNIPGYKEDDFAGLISYADMSSYPDKDILITVRAYREFWYELDYHTGKVTPAYGYILRSDYD